MDFSQLHAKLSSLIWSSRLSLWAERLLISFQSLLLWVSVFICLALFDLNTNTLSFVFWLGFAGLFGWSLVKFKAPTSFEIEERLEHGSALRHRPLRSKQDSPAKDLTEDGQSLWEIEQSRKRGQLKFLRWISPAFNMTQRDPYALRIALTLLIIVGVVISGPATGVKISSALFPFMPSFAEKAGSALKIVITPPTYTRKPQLVLTGRPAEPLSIPQGSGVRVLMQSWIGHIHIVINDDKTELIRDGETDVYTAETLIPETDKIKIIQFGLPRVTIPVSIIPDTPPSIFMRSEPEIIAGGQLKLPLTVQDDYGLKLIRVRAILSPEIKLRPLGRPVFEEQSIIVPLENKPADINPRFNLTGHPWAGYPVSLLIEADDYADQTATVEPIPITLPERSFRHPVAREIIETRKYLIQNGEPAAGSAALKIVESLSRPGRYEWDHVVTLALRSSLSRLGYEPTLANVESVIDTLWQTALRLEDGGLTNTQADLRKALENLQRAVQENKSPEVIAEMLQEFREALSRHLQAMQKQIAQKQAQGEMMPLSPDMMMQMIDPSMLGDFLSQLENELMNGDIESAMKKLENLQKMSEMLDPAMAQPIPEGVKEAMKNLQDIQKVIDKQQALLDATRSKKDKNSEAEQKKQSEIQADLDGVTDSIKKSGGTIPDQIEGAGDAMGKSNAALAANNPGGAIPHQQAALDQLRQGKQSMQQALKERMQQMMGMSIGSMPQSRDPLGRNSPDMNGKDIFNESVKIPTGAERKKADEILKMIRERSSDLSRPQAEREYYQRLLRQW
jgi:uncharacterized protein (TIGR02302 family)